MKRAFEQVQEMEEDEKKVELPVSAAGGVGVGASAPAYSKMEEEMQELERLGGKEIKVVKNGKFVLKHTKMNFVYKTRIPKYFVKVFFINLVKSSEEKDPEIYVAHENGKAGNYQHTHVCVNFKRQFQSRNT